MEGSLELLNLSRRACWEAKKSRLQGYGVEQDLTQKSLLLLLRTLLMHTLIANNFSQARKEGLEFDYFYILRNQVGNNSITFNQKLTLQATEVQPTMMQQKT
jgi:hypothetical protein